MTEPRIVVEESQVALLKERLKEAIKVIEFYADKNNWHFSIMIRKEKNKEEFLDAYKTFSSIDLENHGEFMLYAGKKAREFLKTLEK